MPDDNGILARVPGEYIAQCSFQLPPAGAPDAPATASAVIEVGGDWQLGLVRIHYQRTQMRHGRHSHWSWVAVKADKESTP